MIFTEVLLWFQIGFKAQKNWLLSLIAFFYKISLYKKFINVFRATKKIKLHIMM
jgi:hypothetical protein